MGGISARTWLSTTLGGAALVGAADAVHVVASGRLSLGGVGVAALIGAGVATGLAVMLVPAVLGALIPRARAAGWSTGMLFGLGVGVGVRQVLLNAPWPESQVRFLVGGALVAVLAGWALLRLLDRWSRGRDAVAVLTCVAVVVLPMVGRVTVPVGKPASLDRPNLLLVTLDGARADRFVSGSKDTPAFQALAAAGTRFDLAVAPGPRGASAVSDLLLARPVEAAPVTEGGLGKVLGPSGYAVAAFLGGPVQVPDAESWAVIDDDASWPKGIGRTMAGRLLAVLAHHPTPSSRRAGDVVDRALRFLGTRSGSFAVWVHLTDPLPPFDPPAPFDARFDDGRSEHGGAGPTLGERKLLAPEASAYKNVVDPGWVNARYDGEVAYTDSQLGRLLDGLDAAGWSGTTLVAVVGVAGLDLDEGDAWYGRGRQLTEGLIHVPAAIRLPGRVPVGDTVRSPIEVADLGATLLDLMGQPLKDSGRAPSLRPTIEGTGIARRHAVAQDGESRAVRMPSSLVSFAPGVGWRAWRTEDAARDPAAWTKVRLLDMIGRLPSAASVPPPDDAAAASMLRVLSPSIASPFEGSFSE